jgi:uncharacterized protein (TIGR03435 family)
VGLRARQNVHSVTEPLVPFRLPEWPPFLLPPTAPVADKTGLTGKYSFAIEFNPGGRGTAPRTAAEEASEPTTDLFAVLQGQLGLKLERKETPRNALVIDRIQKTPVEN